MDNINEIKLKSGTPEYHRWWRQQKKLNNPEYHERQKELSNIRAKKQYEKIKDTQEIKERQKKYYYEVVKPRRLALKAKLEE
jgi:hypothetical protein